MQHKDTGLMRQMHAYIEQFYLSHDRTPSTTEIARKFGIARSSAQRYMAAMRAEGPVCGHGHGEDLHLH